MEKALIITLVLCMALIFVVEAAPQMGMAGAGANGAADAAAAAQAGANAGVNFGATAGLGAAANFGARVAEAIRGMMGMGKK
ncbi:uncharacterized protein [Parasteatoda tepidariorum]|uniref:uncharacterized protein n=1 Tax=Parasteatoda tepidariorum TaxID=114398 RepID=UPI000A2C03BB|nr:fibroin heavy chain [Parasteatoda tepidariorum]